MIVKLRGPKKYEAPKAGDNLDRSFRYEFESIALLRGVNATKKMEADDRVSI